MARVDVFREGVTLPRGGVTVRSIRRIASSCAERLGLGDASITIIITDDPYLRRINREFRGTDIATDVISFPTRENPFPAVDDFPHEIGDIYISMPRAESQAAEYGVSPADEIKRLIIHGILHLKGYDHERSVKDEKTMRRKEEELFRDCGA